MMKVIIDVIGQSKSRTKQRRGQYTRKLDRKKRDSGILALPAVKYTRMHVVQLFYLAQWVLRAT